MWGPGLALRGPKGMESFNQAVGYLKSEQHSIYLIFNLSILLYRPFLNSDVGDKLIYFVTFQ